jgi:sporulation protein YlmC with PRC-barrel domain
MTAGKVRDLALHLLDRQVVDTDGRAVGKVDDVELHVPEDGSPPYVVAMLTGPQALGPRLGGKVGEWVVFWAHALSRGSDDKPGRIGMELVTDLGSCITVSRSRPDLGIHPNEDRARRYLVERIPGARDART